MENGHNVNIGYFLAKHLVYVVFLKSKAICIVRLLRTIIQEADLDFNFNLLSLVKEKTRINFHTLEEM